MKREALLVIESDPRSSPRPAEALRMAAGLGVWRKVNVTVVLAGESARLVGAAGADCVDGESVSRYLALLVESGEALCLQEDNPANPGAAERRWPTRCLSTGQLARLAASSDCLLHF